MGFLTSAWFYMVVGLLAGLLSMRARRRRGALPQVQTLVAGCAIVGAIFAANSLGYNQVSKWLALTGIGVLAASASYAFKYLQKEISTSTPKA